MDANLFTEGAIYWYENKTNTKKDYDDNTLNHDFLVSRPVYILKSNKSIFDEFTVNVVTITSSQRRVGIPINIDGVRNGKIMPYNIRSVHTEYLTRYMGHVSQELMEEVSQSVQYHLGFTDEKPRYLAEYEELEASRDNFINSLNTREATIFEFLDKKCVYKPNYYVEASELFQSYIKNYPNSGYSRLQDFNVCVQKLTKLFTSIEIKVEHQKKIFCGVSINGNVHKIDAVEVVSDNTGHKKKLFSDEINIDFENMTRDQILETLDDKSKKGYYSMDIIQKLDNYGRNINNMRLPNVSEKDIPAIRLLIRGDIEEKKQKVFRLMKQHVNPLNMNTVDQYVVFVCTNDEIMKYIDEKYLKKGGIHKVRKSLKNNVQHYFVKCK